MRRTLVLFDIDGTILSASGVSAESLRLALAEVAQWHGSYGDYDFSGRTDPQIVRDVLRRDGWDDATLARLLPDILTAYHARLKAALQPEHVKLKPGVVALIRELEAQPDVTLGLLTGNLEPCARVKLDPPGLNPHFAFGAYGSDHADRYCLAPVALQRAHAHTGHAFAGTDTVIIGDSIHDVRCCASVGVRAVAVATGKTSRETLAAERPHALFDDLRETKAVVRAVLGGS